MQKPKSDHILFQRKLGAFVHLALVLTLAGLSAPTFAATQGDWGRSSSASAKITLRILPRNEQPVEILRSATLGHKAIQAYCATTASFNQSATLFTASLPQHSGDLDQLLRMSCSRRAAPLYVSEGQAGPATGPVTVLIAPV